MAEFTEQDQPIKLIDSAYQTGIIQHFKELSVGAGLNLFKANSEGIFAGGTDFTTAPWSLDYTGKQYVGANGEIVLDAPNKKITVGSGITIDGATETITTNKIVDSTYGFYGCFVKVYTTTATTGSTQYTIPANGGLVNIAVNMLDTGSPASFIDVPSWNGLSVGWECVLSGGNYVITIHNENIHNDYFPLTKVFTTVFFNSLETSGF